MEAEIIYSVENGKDLVYGWIGGCVTFMIYCWGEKEKSKVMNGCPWCYSQIMYNMILGQILKESIINVECYFNQLMCTFIYVYES